MDIWTSDALAEDGAQAFFKAAADRQASAERSAATTNRLGFIVGVAGALIGLFGSAAALTTYIKTPVAEPPRYVGIIDNETGIVHHPVSVTDAPRLFGESVRQRAMRDFIVACESYIPQTWAKVDYHTCMVMATSDEQKRRERDIGRNGPHYPVTTFGPTGWAMPTEFLAFVKFGEVGTEPNQTFHYSVRYERTEVINGIETHPRYSADIAFAFHPELKISAADALVNSSGFQTVSFSTVKDRTP